MRFTIDLPDVETGTRGAYLSDRDDQPFVWPIQGDDQTISFEPPAEPFGLNVFWRRAGREPIWITADAGGRYYGRGDGPAQSLASQLVYSGLERLRAVRGRYERTGFTAPRDVQERLEAATARAADLARRAAVRRRGGADGAGRRRRGARAAYARSRPVNHRQHIGCDVRQMYLIHPERFRARFNRLFDYATVVFYVKSRGYEYFEPIEGDYRFELRDLWISWLERAGKVIEGRPVLWFHSWVTPEWLERKSAAPARASRPGPSRSPTEHRSRGGVGDP